MKLNEQERQELHKEFVEFFEQLAEENGLEILDKDQELNIIIDKRLDSNGFPVMLTNQFLEQEGFKWNPENRKYEGTTYKIKWWGVHATSELPMAVYGEKWKITGWRYHFGALRIFGPYKGSDHHSSLTT